jgi:putative nucleotidyltransferase with HDIG domain
VSSVPEAPTQRLPRDGNAADALVTVAACAATAVIALTAQSAWEQMSARPAAFLAFLALTVSLQLVAVNVYGRGHVSVSGVGVLAVGFTFGVGAALAAALLSALLHTARTRTKPYKAVFNVANLALAGAAAAGTYRAFAPLLDAPLGRLGAAFAAGAALWLVNIGLLCAAMSLAEGSNPLAVWRERFRWLTLHYLAFGPLALASVVAYEKVGLPGLLAFGLPPAMLTLTVRQYLERTRAAVEEVRRANDELRRANDELEARNADLRELYEFAGGLAAQAHDRDALVAYAESSLARMAGVPVRVAVGLGDADGDLLVAGGNPIGSVHAGRGERWLRLRDALLPQVATAFESAGLVEELRKTHLETIAALSRSMEAKDYYTGGHTERVATVAVALARRLGFQGADLEAVEVGALLHDIGKIGIPERILHKPGPLDEDEWKVMKEHPVISEFILSEVDLNPIVCQIARSSHERIDGGGYPDGLAGAEIPLPARIVLVADAFDALTSDRPYRRGRRVRAAVEELREHVGTQLCPQVMDALEALYREEPHVLAGGEVRALSAA